MSLFEIDIHKDFQILNTNVFLSREKLEKYYKLNNLNDGYKDDISEYLLDDLSLKVYHDLFVMSNFRYDAEELLSIIKSNLYLSNIESKEAILYPEWILFFIAIVKKKVSFIHEKEFRDYLKYFKYIAEVRYKRYIIRNINNFIHHKHYGKSDDIKDDLYSQFLEYMNDSKFTTEELFSFLNFIYSLHLQLKENEKYKLMWNLETYIIETIKLLLDNDVPMTEIYSTTYKGMRGTYSVLHDIHTYKPLYIEESKHYFQSHLSKINDVFQINITLDAFMNILISNEKYNDILFAYLELLKRFNANKRSEDVMGAMIKGVVLGIEEHIKNITISDSLPLQLEELSNYKKLFNSIRIKEKEHQNNGDKLLALIDELIEKRELKYLRLNLKWSEKTHQSSLYPFQLKQNRLEKYLAIYYGARNYLAHNNIDMNKFFWGEDGNRRIISNVIDSVMIILYKLETINQESKK